MTGSLTIDEAEANLVKYIAALAYASPILSQLHELELEPKDIQDALCSVFDIDNTSLNPAELPEKRLDGERIVELLRDFDFPLHPEILAEFELEEGIIPAGIPGRLVEKTVKVKGEIWRVHKNDADPWPSNPHAHNIGTMLVLHLGNGDLFDGRRLVENIGKKRLIAIREKLGDIELPAMTE